MPVHRSIFVNLALSGESEKYVITNIYRLTEKTRRKRQVDNNIIVAKMAIENDDALSFFHGHSVFRRRYRRDIDDSVQQSHSQRYAYTSLGCPAGATHKDMECHCPAGMEYSTGTYQCEVEVSNVIDTNEVVGVIVFGDDDQEEETNVIESDSDDSDSGVDGLKLSAVVIVMMFCMHSCFRF